MVYKLKRCFLSTHSVPVFFPDTLYVLHEYLF